MDTAAQLVDGQLMGELPSTDALSTLLNKHLPAHIRPPRELSGTWHSTGAAEVNEAVSTHSWRRIATLAKARIQETGDEGLVHTLEWWSVRLHALYRLRLFSLLRTEMLGLWSAMESISMSSSSSSSSSSMSLAESVLVPFSLRVLRAREPRMRGSVTESIDAHLGLIAFCKAWVRTWRRAARTATDDETRTEANVQKRIWIDRATRVGVMTAALLAQAKDFASALTLLEPLVAKASQDASCDSDSDMLVLAARLHMQAGSLDDAGELLSRASAEAEREGKGDLLSRASAPELDPELAQDKAVLSAMRGEYAAAETILRASARARAEASVNNVALCMFYQGRLEEPIESLEALLADSAGSVTNCEALLFNLCTLHELRSDDAMGDKRRILALVGQWAGEGSGTACLKLT